MPRFVEYFFVPMTDSAAGGAVCCGRVNRPVFILLLAHYVYPLIMMAGARTATKTRSQPPLLQIDEDLLRRRRRHYCRKGAGNDGKYSAIDVCRTTTTTVNTTDGGSKIMNINFLIKGNSKQPTTMTGEQTTTDR